MLCPKIRFLFSCVLSIFCCSCGKPVNIKDDSKELVVRDVSSIVPSQSSDGVGFQHDKNGSAILSFNIDQTNCTDSVSKFAVMPNTFTSEIPERIFVGDSNLFFIEIKFVSSIFPVILKCYYDRNQLGPNSNEVSLNFCVDDQVNVSQNNYFSFHQQHNDVVVNREGRSEVSVELKQNDRVFLKAVSSSQNCQDLEIFAEFELF